MEQKFWPANFEIDEFPEMCDHCTSFTIKEDEVAAFDIPYLTLISCEHMHLCSKLWKKARKEQDEKYNRIWNDILSRCSDGVRSELSRIKEEVCSGEGR